MTRQCAPVTVVAMNPRLLNAPATVSAVLVGCAVLRSTSSALLAVLIKLRHPFVALGAELVARFSRQIDLGQVDGGEDSNRGPLLPVAALLPVPVAGIGQVGHLVVGHLDLRQRQLDLEVMHDLRAWVQNGSKPKKNLSIAL